MMPALKLIPSWPRRAALALAAAALALAAPRAARADFTTPGARPFTAVAAGSTHTCAVRGDGQVQCWGSNASGQLGNGMDVQATGPDGAVGMSTEDQPMQRPEELGSCTDDAECPEGQCGPQGLCLCSAGYCPSSSTCGGGAVCQPMACSLPGQCPWGYTCSGGACRPWPQPLIPVVPNLTGAVGVAAGDSHTCVLLYGGTVKCWGENSSGQLGTGDFRDSSVPVQVSGIGGAATPAIAIAAGAFHTCALLGDGSVKCWGDANQGQLGNGATSGRSATPVQVVTGGFGFVVNGLRSIAAGGDHTCAIHVSGQVYCWGANFAGQLGNGSTTLQSHPVTASGISPASGYTAIGVSAGRAHTCAQLVATTGGNKTITACWGDNGHGQLGNGGSADSSVPVLLTSYPNVRSVAAGGDHACALFTDGTVRCWGDDAEGQIGNGLSGRLDTASPDLAHAKAGVPTAVTTLPRARALALGAGHSCAVVAGGTVQCWGANLRDQTGDGSIFERTAPSSAAPAAGVSAAAVPQISGGDYHTCATLSTGAVKCWGYDYWGQVGNGQWGGGDVLTPTAVGGVDEVISTCAGQDHSCALRADGSVWCWGLNNHGQIGNGASGTVGIPAPSRVRASFLTYLGNAAQIACAGFHSCALLGDGTVKCWGDDDSGQIGNGGAVPGSDALYPSTVITASGAPLSGVTEIQTGLAFTCAVAQGGAVSCWGNNSAGQLARTGGSQSSAVSVTLGAPVKSLGLGGYHACVVLASGAMQCWGSDVYGQLGDNKSGAPLGTPVNVLSLGGKAISAGGGGYHTCALLADSSMRCWGEGTYGELGDNSSAEADTPATVDWLLWGWPQTQYFATALGVGGWHGCALTVDGSGRCWGYDYHGELGNNATGSSPYYAYYTAQYTALP